MNSQKDVLIHHIVDISKKMVDGELQEIDLSLIQQEINDLAGNFQHIIDNFKVLGESLHDSSKVMPVLAEQLSNVSETTTQGVMKVMDNAEGIMNSAAELSGKVDAIQQKYNDIDEELKADLSDVAGEANITQNQAFGILTALEFEDINKQLLTKVLEALNEFQGQFYKLILLLRLKDFMDNQETNHKVLDDLRQVVDYESKADSEEKQDLIDELFKEFGL